MGINLLDSCSIHVCSLQLCCLLIVICGICMVIVLTQEFKLVVHHGALKLRVDHKPDAKSIYQSSHNVLRHLTCSWYTSEKRAEPDEIHASMPERRRGHDGETTA